MSGPKKVKSLSFADLCGNSPPVITTRPQATSVKELVDGAPNENILVHTRTGSIKFRDSDTSDKHTAKVAPLGSGFIGTFKLGPVNQGANSVGWKFQIPDSVLDPMQEGQTIIQKYRVTVKDGHGGKDTLIVTVKIVGTNDVPVVLLDPQSEGSEVFGSVIEDFNVDPSGNLTDNNSFIFDDVDLLDTHTLTIIPDSGNAVGGTLTAVVTDPATGAGTGTIAWVYTVDNDLVQYLDDFESTTETFIIRIDDGHGGTVDQPITVFISGVNDAPVANPDTNWVKEDTDLAAAGNVLTTTPHLGAPAGSFTDQADTDVDVEPLTVTEVNGNAGNVGLAVNGLFGKLTLNSSGTYTYTLYTLAENAAAFALVQGLAPGDAPLTDTFSYTITDGTVPASSILTISVFGTDDPVTITDLTPKANGGDATVDEDDLADGTSPDPAALTQTGTFTISAPDGLDDLTVDGNPVITNGVFTATSFTTPLGNTLSFTGYNPATGVVTYTYTLVDNEAHPAAGGENDLFEDFTVVLTDTDTSTVSDTLSVRIVDDVLQAIDDPLGVIPEDALFLFNVLTNDTQGADRPTTVVSVSPLPASTGTLLFDPNGDMIFDPAPGFEGPVTFTYTIEDADGDQSTATVTLVVDRDSVPSITVSDGLVDETGLPDGTGELADPAPDTDTSETATGSITISTGGDTLSKLEVQDKDGNWIDVTASGGTVQGDYGVLTIVKTGSTYSWSYTLSDNTLDHPLANVTGAGDQVFDNFATRATDSDTDQTDTDGIQAAEIITIAINDNGPTVVANFAANSIAVLDETATGSTSATIALGAILAGEDPDVPGAGVIATATSISAVISPDIVFGADGPNATDPAIYALSVGAVPPGISVTDGSPVNLVQVSATVVAGVVQGGPFGGTAAFAVEIDPATGIITVEQYLSLQHPDSGNPNDVIDIADFALVATVTVTDGDGDTAGAGYTIGDRIQFFDAGPTANDDTDSVSAVSVSVLTFDDIVLAEGGEQPLTSYGGFTWSQTGVYNPVTIPPGYVPASGENLAFFAEATGLEVAGYPLPAGTPLAATNGVFTFLGASFVSAFAGTLTVTAEGFDGATSLGTYSFDATYGVPVHIDFSSLPQFNGIDRITFDAPNYFGFDNFTTVAQAPAATGNVITTADGGLGTDANGTDGVADDLGADGLGGITWTGESGGTIQGLYGVLTVNAAGDYSYQLDSANADVLALGDGDALVESFTYTITDGDGDSATATLDITINGADDPVVITDLVPAAFGGDVTVDEDDLPDGTSPNPGALTQTGTFTLLAPDGVATLIIGGTTIVSGGIVTLPALPITTSYGELTITAVNLATGVVSYAYTLTDNTLDHGPANDGQDSVFDNVAISLTDADGDIANATLAVRVIDDVLQAVDDALGVIVEDAPFSFNVLTNDTQGADRVATVVAITPPPAAQGTVTFAANGAMTFDPAPGFAGAVSFTYTIEDADGDQSTATVTLTVNSDSIPRVATAQNVLVDEDGLPGHVVDALRPGETDANELAVNTGSVVVDFGNDVPVTLISSIALVDSPTLDGQLQTLSGANVEFALESGKLVGRPAGGGAPVITIEITAAVAGPGASDVTYTYQVTLHQPVQHPNAGTEDSDFLSGVTFQVTDSDGTTATGAFNVEVVDDKPITAVTAASDAAVLLTTQDAETIGAATDTATASFAALFAATPAYGADGPGTTAVSYTLTLAVANGTDSGLDSDGAQINLFNVGGVIYGSTTANIVDAVANAVFSIGVDASGLVTLSQLREIDHALPGVSSNYDTQLAALANGLVSLNASALTTDGDGDTATASASIDLGGNIRFADHGPSVTLALNTAAALTIDETDGVAANANETDPVGGNLGTATLAASAYLTDTTSFGADGPGSASFNISVNIATPTGLFDTATGLQIVLVPQSATLINATAGPGGPVVFTIAIDALTGALSVTQLRAVVHDDPADHDESTTPAILAHQSLNVTKSVIDGDGDTAASSISIGSLIRFEDSGPSFTGSAQSPSSVVHDETGGIQNGGAGDLDGNDVLFSSLPSAIQTQFTGLSPIVDDPDVGSDTGGAIGYAQSTGPMLGGLTANFGEDGFGSQSYALVLNGGSGVSSGLSTTEGLPISLFQVSPTLIVGRYDGADAGTTVTAADPVAFAIALDPATGLAYTAQYVSLDHPNEANAGNGFVSLDEDVAITAGRISVAATITDGDGDSATASVDISGNIRFEDSGPTAAADSKTISEDTAIDSNIMLLLDVSGSMGDPSGLTGLTRLDVMKASVIELLEQYDGIGSVAVRIVTFSSSANAVGATWMTVDAAKAAVLALTAGGATNYEETLTDAVAAFSSGGKISGAQNVAYFVSDGQPNTPDNSGINGAEVTAWETFLDANDVVSFALGAGTGVTTSALDPVAYNGVTGAQIPSLVVTDLSQLTATLVGTVAGATTSGTLPVTFGSDGGYVKSVEIGGKTFSYNPVADTITVTGAGAASHTFNTATNVLNITTAIGGLLALDLDTGAYIYTGPASVTSNQTDLFAYTVSDNDNDLQSSTLTVNVLNADRPPLVRDDGVITNVSGSGATIVIPDYALLYNDTDPDGQAISVTAVGAPQSDLNTVSLLAGNVSFVDNDSDGGTFTYTGATTAPVVTDTGFVSVNRAQAGESTLDGTGLDNILIGRSSNNDTIRGYEGRDVLIGDGGADTLNGGKGADLLVGGAGSDSFQFIAGDSGQTAGLIDVIRDYAKGAAGTGDEFDYSSSLAIGGSAAAATATQASINATTGVATFAAGSGTTLDDALLDIAARFQAATTSSGEFALFRVNGTGDFHLFISDATDGVSANDVVVQLQGITSIGSINISGGDLTILA